MTEITPTLTTFVASIEESQKLWALQDETGEGWVVCDSPNFEDTDTMPIWSSEKLAKQHCIDEWEDYKPAAITVTEYLEFWVSDLNDDDVMVGMDWMHNNYHAEIDPIELAKHFVEIEAEAESEDN